MPRSIFFCEFRDKDERGKMIFKEPESSSMKDEPHHDFLKIIVALDVERY